MPTVTAYQVELEFINAIKEGSIAEDRLRDLVRAYIETHSGEALGDWTDKRVPLFYMKLLDNGESVESYEANYIQVCIIRELWLRTSPEASFNLIRL